jgi:hypothetical protein
MVELEDSGGLMKALTVKAPWATAIARFGKDIENRSWKPPAGVLGTPIAIHEGAGLVRAGLLELEQEFGKVPYEHGIITCTAIVQGWIDANGDHSDSLTAREAARARRSPWYGGDVGWVLSRVRRPRTKVKIKGMLGVWSLPARAAKRLGRAR